MRSNKHVKTYILLLSVMALLASCAMGLWNARSEFDLGIGFFNRGQFSEAIPHFRQATELEPNYAEAYLYLGRCYVSLGRYLEAIPPLRTAYSLYPEGVRREAFNILLDALLGAGLSELKQGNLGGAIGHFKDALNLDPQSRQIKDDLSQALISHGAELLSRGNVNGAIDTYKDALSYSPNNISAYVGMAKAFLQSGDMRRAMEALQNANQIDSGNRDVLNLLRELLTK